jgi:cyclopropane-fatty-acyl-phospholipid synthase
MNTQQTTQAPIQLQQAPNITLDTRLTREAAELLARADIHLNGRAAWDMQLRKPGVPERAFASGNLGLGEAYMDGDWDAQQLDEFFCHLLRARVADDVRPMRLAFHALYARLFNLQTERRAWMVGKEHYDLGNAFYAAMLDPRMTYTCGYWKDASNLAEAQEAKLDLICRKLRLEPGMRVLDIGCG